jgi:hypothetical protein
MAALLLLTSCASEELRKEIDQVFELQKQANYEEGKRIPWAVGQWALFRTTETGGETILRVFSSESRGFRRLAITKKEGSAFWLEVREVQPCDERRFALLVDNVDRDRMRDLRLLQLKILDSDGKIITIDGNEGGPSAARDLRARFRSFAGAMYLVGGTGRVRKVTVPAGTFAETYVVPISMSLDSGRQAGHVWFTNAVPIVYHARYFSRAVSWVWGESTVLHELVDFGLQGAQSAFFEEQTVAGESPAGTRGERE